MYSSGRYSEFRIPHDRKGRKCRAGSGITLMPAGPSTAPDPARPSNPKRTTDVLRKPDNSKSYRQRVASSADVAFYFAEARRRQTERRPLLYQTLNQKPRMQARAEKALVPPWPRQPSNGRVHAMLLSSRDVVVVWWLLIQAAMSSGLNGLMKKASNRECSLIGGACTDARITRTPGQ